MSSHQMRDALGRVTQSSFKDIPSGDTHTRTLAWNGLLRIGSITDNNGRAVSYGYDAGGLLQWAEDSLTVANRNRTEVERNLQGEVVKLLQKVQEESTSGSYTLRTYETRYAYDDWGRVKQVDRYGRAAAAQGTRKYAFDTLGNLTWYEDSVGRSALRDFDGLGRVRKTTRKPRPGTTTGDIVTEQIFDDAPGADPYPDGFGGVLDATTLSQVITRKDHRGLATRYFLDKRGRLVERRLPGYTSAGAGFSWTYRYDDEGRLLQWRDGNGHDVFLTRNADPFRRVTRRHVDPVGTQALSLMTAYEEWSYDDVQGKRTQRTHSDVRFGQGTGNWLVNEVVDSDALGRLQSEDFGYGDDGTHAPRSVKTLTHGYSFGASGIDTAFRRSLATSSGWSFRFTPDGAGKLAKMELQGPGDAGPFDAALYRYEGGRVSTRDFRTTNGKKYYRNTWTTDDLGYLTGLGAVYDPGGAGTSVFSLTQTVDAEGNVTEKQYPKMSGQAGDLFELDGHDRLVDAKLGVPQAAFGQGFDNASVYDGRLQYALDLAQNRTSVTTTQGTSVWTDLYSVDAASNRYLDAGYGPLTYDKNGNLVFDGFRLYVYDYLDRLCEVYDYAAGTQSATSSSATAYRSPTWANKPLELTEAQIDQALTTLQRTGYSETAREKDGIRTLNTSLAREKQKASRSSSSSTANAGLEFTLVAVYGYDPSNRRVYRATLAGIRWSSYDGWQTLEEFEDDGTTTFSPRAVYFDGIGIDEHLGYATTPDGVNWTRYTYTQDSLGHVMRVHGPDGNPVEAYDYDPYGARSVWQWSGTQWNAVADTLIANSYGATGRRHDAETGLIYLRNRYLDPGMGRFITRDPIGAWADRANLGNAHTYAGNQPQSLTDPLGLDSLPNQDELQSSQDPAAPGKAKGSCITDPNKLTLGTRVYKLRKPESGFKTGNTRVQLFWHGIFVGTTMITIDGVNKPGQATSGTGNGRITSARTWRFFAVIRDTVTFIDNVVTVAEYAAGIGAAAIAIRQVWRTGGVNLAKRILNGIKGIFGKRAARGVVRFADPKFAAQLERQLAKDGSSSIFKSLRSLEKRLAEHQAKLPDLKYTSSVEREIRTFQRQIDTLKEFIKQKGLGQ